MSENTPTESKKKYIQRKIGEMSRGDWFPSTQTKYILLCYSMGIVHIAIAILFFCLKSPILGVYNLFSTFLFLRALPMELKAEKFLNVFVTAFIEILLHASVVTILLGWNWGFMLYAIAISPASFMVTYSIPGRKRSLLLPAIFSLIAMAVYILVRSWSTHHEPYFCDVTSSAIINGVYHMNSLVTFCSIIFLTSIFALELVAKEKALEKQNATLTDISSIDPLTKLLNRRSMSTYLNEAVNSIKENGKLFSLAIGDIDNFKMVNDIHGHNVGDDVLIMVSKTIKETLPKEATLCRWGGEEFLILLPVSEADAVPIIESVRYAITQISTRVEKPDGYLDLAVSMTFGVSQYIHGFTIDQVISVADENLYRGKANGKNRVVHSKTVL